jgi:PAS domain S-box-containing protein
MANHMDLEEIHALKNELASLKKANRKLYNEKNRLNTLLELLPEAVYETDVNFNITYANKSALKMFGYSRLDIARKLNAVLFFVEEEKERIQKNRIKQLRKEKIGALEYLARRKDGSTFPALIHSSLIEENGEIIGTRGLVFDISSFKESENRLAKTEEKFLDMFNMLQDGIIYFSSNGKVLAVNKAFQKMFDVRLEDVVGKRFIELSQKVLDTEALQALLPRIKKIYSYGKTQQSIFKFKSKVIEFSYIRNTKSGYVTGVMKDVSDRKSYEDIFNTISEAIYILDKNGIFIDVNHGAEVMYGMDRNELIGKTPLDVAAKGKNNLGKLSKRLKDVYEKGETAQFNFWGVRKNGEEFIKEVIVKRNDYFGAKALIATARDISERVKAEMEKLKLEAHLRDTQKTETIGALASGIAHDFNNVLAPMMGFTELALLKLSQNEDVTDDLQKVLQSTIRAKGMVQQILLFGKGSEKEKRTLSLQRVVREALRLLKTSIPKSVKIDFDIDETCPDIVADGTQIHQLIVNLCTNSWQSIEESGTITIRLSKVKKEELKNDVLSKLKDQTYALLTVEDNGCGMSEDVKEKIFDLFFSAKSNGTGLGLSVVRRIVRNHEGEIIVNSKLGRGTEFNVYLPVGEEKPKKENIALPEENCRGDETIMVVDDEPDILELSKKLLENCGYTAITFQESKEAVKAFRKESGKYSLLLSDLTMPDVSGLDLAKVVHQLKPKLPIIIMTGYGENITEQEKKDLGIKKIISKPVPANLLTQTIRKALDDF